MEKIRLAAAAGFAGIELWINDVYEHVGRGGEVSEIEKALRDNGLIVPCTIATRCWGEATGLEYQIALDETKRRMEMAARLGSPYIVATPPREPEDFAQLTRRYKDLLELGRQTGVKPTFEYISFFKSTFALKHAWQIVQDVDDPDATLILDAFHSWNSHSTIEELRQIPAGRISHYHIDDADANIPAGEQKDPDRVMLGEGVIDLKAEIAVLKEIGYEGTVSLELFNPKLWEQDPAEVLKVGIERMRELFD
ncbi:MAG: 2-keto-myo-inositol isomerase [Pirellulaceae bacterium]|jgi:2-keto-myo-inositol isomerase